MLHIGDCNGTAERQFSAAVHRNSQTQGFVTRCRLTLYIALMHHYAAALPACSVIDGVTGRCSEFVRTPNRVVSRLDLTPKVVVARGTLKLGRGSAYGFRSRN